MAFVSPQVRLQRAPDVRLQLSTANTVLVEVPDGMLDCGQAGLRVLERFARPTSLRELAAEPAASPHEWMDRLDVALALARNGVLRDVMAGDAPAEPEPRYDFDNPWAHIRMLDDVPRTEKFMRAIEVTVARGDTVVDIGTGTGILAMAAARAGADHVYAIEAGAIADKAAEVIAANGLADQVSVMRGWSSAVSLPRRADVLITETIGSEPLDERILETVADARRRLLVPGARVIPSRLRILAAPVEVPEAAIAGRVFTMSATERWQQRYGFVFTPLVGQRRLRGLRVKSLETRAWKRLAAPALLADLDLTTLANPSVDANVELAIERDGRFDGALLHFEAELASGIRISSDPMRAHDHDSWRNVLTLQPPSAVRSGDRVRLAYRWRAGTRATGLSIGS